MKPGKDLVSLDVKVEKSDEELGLNIFEKYVGSGVFISSVFSGSPAEGIVKDGDHILKVNGADVKSASQDEVVQLLKNAKGIVKLNIGRPKNPKSTTEHSTHIAKLLADIERESLRLEHNYKQRRVRYENDRSPNDHFVEMEKTPSQSLGIDIAGGKSSPLGNVPIIISTVKANGPAADKLQVGDVILSINGQTTEKKTHEEVVWMIRGSVDAIILMKVRRGEEDVKRVVECLAEATNSVSQLITSSMKFDVLPETPTATPESIGQPVVQRRAFMELSKSDVKRKVEIVLDQGEEGLGFSVVGGIGSVHGDLPIFVKSIFDSGAAAKEGHLTRGDRILSVNGETLDGCTHAEGVSLLKKAKGRVVLSVIPT